MLVEGALFGRPMQRKPASGVARHAGQKPDRKKPSRKSGKVALMFALLIAASLSNSPTAELRHTAAIRTASRAAPCQAVPSICLTRRGDGAGPRWIESRAPAIDSKMNAYRFDARPCRIIGNMDCPKRARRQIFRLGEPIQRTLARSLGLD